MMLDTDEGRDAVSTLRSNATEDGPRVQAERQLGPTRFMERPPPVCNPATTVGECFPTSSPGPLKKRLEISGGTEEYSA